MKLILIYFFVLLN